MSTLWKFCSQLKIPIPQPSFNLNRIVQRGKRYNNAVPKKRIPPWLPKPLATKSKIDLTYENREFIQTVIREEFSQCNNHSPLKVEPIEPVQEWNPNSKRCGLLAKKIGLYPLWTKDGKRIYTTLLQIIDNQVIKYISPKDFTPMIGKPKIQVKKPLGCLIIGAESDDPQNFTKHYSRMFENVGIMPKKVVGRFMISEDAALEPGTPLFATHYKPGDYVDIRGKTVDRGFQGVMKRWGFHGMPATHGVTKTHRRPGNIGSGGKKSRVMPGTKLPGHMGNRYRILRGVKILRINTKYNVLWVLGDGIPGETNNTVQIFDTVLPLKKFKEAPAFPTYFPDGKELPEEIAVDDLHMFDQPTIEYEVEEVQKKK